MKLKHLVALWMLLIFVAVLSGCIEQRAIESAQTQQQTPESGLVYGGELRIDTGGSGYVKVIRIYDTVENKVCYMGYSGIDCEERTTSERSKIYTGSGEQ